MSILGSPTCLPIPHASASQLPDPACTKGTLYLLTLSPRHPAGGKPEAASTHSSKVSLSELLSFRGARIGVILFLLQQFSGINAVIYFSTKVFAQVSIAASSLYCCGLLPGQGQALPTSSPDLITHVTHEGPWTGGRGLLQALPPAIFCDQCF